MIFRKIADTERFTLNFKELELANRIVTDIFDNAAGNPYRAKDGKFTTGPSTNNLPDSIVDKKGTTYYHGTTKENAKSILKNGFDNNLNTKGYAESPYATFISRSNKDDSDHSAGSYGEVILEVKAKKSIIYLDGNSQKWADTMGQSRGVDDSKKWAIQLKKDGYDGIAEANGEIAIWNTDNLEIVGVVDNHFDGQIDNKNYNPNRDKSGKFTFGPSGAINSSPQHIITMSQEEAEGKILTALEENDIELQEFDVSQYHMAVSRKVSKELPEDIRIGDNYDPNNPSKYLDSKEYYELSKKRQALYDKYMENINKSIGVNTELGSLYITEHNYNYIKNNGEKFLPSQVNFYKAGNFSLKDGRVKLEITENLQGHKPAYWYGMDEEKTFFDNLIANNKFIKVNEKELKSLLSKRAQSDDGIYNLTFPAISRAESRALSEYNLVSAVNQNLRNGKTTKATSYIESAIDKTYSKPQTVYRGLRGEFATKVSNMKPGDTLVDKGFMSTSSQIGSTEIEGARKFGQGGVIMKISTNGGFGTAIDMDPYVSDLRFIGESEVLLNRNINLEMVGAETRTVKDRDGTSSDITIIEFKEK